MARGQVLNDLLTNPTSLQDPCLGVGKAPLEVRNNTIVSGLLTEVVWVLEIKLLVGSSCSGKEISNDPEGYLNRGLNINGIPMIGPPFPLPSSGTPWSNFASRFWRSTAWGAAAVNCAAQDKAKEAESMDGYFIVTRIEGLGKRSSDAKERKPSMLQLTKQ